MNRWCSHCMAAYRVSRLMVLIVHVFSVVYIQGHCTILLLFEEKIPLFAESVRKRLYNTKPGKSLFNVLRMKIQCLVKVRTSEEIQILTNFIYNLIKYFLLYSIMNRRWIMKLDPGAHIRSEWIQCPEFWFLIKDAVGKI
jgi:hypothetical protein